MANVETHAILSIIHRTKTYKKTKDWSYRPSNKRVRTYVLAKIYTMYIFLTSMLVACITTLYSFLW